MLRLNRHSEFIVHPPILVGVTGITHIIDRRVHKYENILVSLSPLVGPSQVVLNGEFIRLIPDVPESEVEPTSAAVTVHKIYITKIVSLF